MELETLLREGKLPARMHNLALCRFMGWSWQELMETPEDAVMDAQRWMHTQAALSWQAGAKR